VSHIPTIWREQMLKHCYPWTGSVDAKTSHQDLRLANFRKYHKLARYREQEMGWLTKAEIAIGTECEKGGDCTADAELL
jgi:hypothetical protein